jgi:hypothetical protein
VFLFSPKINTYSYNKDKKGRERLSYKKVLKILDRGQLAGMIYLRDSVEISKM